MPLGNLMGGGGFDLSQMLGSFGGMNGIFDMTLGTMIEEGGENSSIIISIFSDLNGKNILQSFTSNDFSYLNAQHPSIRKRLVKLI